MKHQLENNKFEFGDNYTYCFHCGWIPKECLKCDCPCDIPEHDIENIENK